MTALANLWKKSYAVSLHLELSSFNISHDLRRQRICRIGISWRQRRGTGRTSSAMPRSGGEHDHDGRESSNQIDCNRGYRALRDTPTSTCYSRFWTVLRRVQLLSAASMASRQILKHLLIHTGSRAGYRRIYFSQVERAYLLFLRNMQHQHPGSFRS